MIIGQKSEVSFKVNVMGTSVEPTARVTLETHPQISFPATKLGDSWVSVIDVPRMIIPGNYKLRVDVLLNNRVFSPFSKMVMVEGAPVSPEEVVMPVEELAVPVEQEQTIQLAASVAAPDVAVEPKLTMIEEVPVKKVVEVTAPAEVPKVKRIIVAEEKPKKITISAADFKFTPKIIERIELPTATPLELKRLVKVVESKPTRGAKKDRPLIEIKHDMPITLTKGEIVYE